MGPAMQLLYTSNAVRDFADHDLTALLGQARKNNAENGVSGLLLYGDEAFMQALEGPEQSVDRVFSAIKTDPRHQDVREIFRVPITEKQFSGWRMGYRRLVADAPREGLFDLTREALSRALPTGEKAVNLRIFMRAFYSVAFPDDEEGEAA